MPRGQLMPYAYVSKRSTVACTTASEFAASIDFSPSAPFMRAPLGAY
jgi:hypothetical protein